MPDIYLCEVAENNKIAEGMFAVSVVSEDLALCARAGQFLHVKCGDERILRRPFGICNVHGGVLDFVFEVKGGGTKWLSKVKPGQTLDILGPLGNGFSFPDGRIIVVGGGLGSPPMLFAARSAKGGVDAILGFRESDRVILVKEFASVCEEVYLTTDDGSAGICGQVTGPLRELLDRGGFDAVLACGQLVMQRAVAELCSRYGVPCQVSLEERMGCGVGACLVCACATVAREGARSGKGSAHFDTSSANSDSGSAHFDTGSAYAATGNARSDAGSGAVQMSRVCLDGPVFDAREVVW